ncbi:MAG: hypothetical protein ACM34K_01770 [Bacillota bacterium]
MTSEGSISHSEFPRDLTLFERECLLYILPSNKPGYNIYRQKIESLSVIGYGRFGQSNLILGEKSAQPDLTAPSAPVFALGAIKFMEKEVYILLHEEFEEQIEFDISGIDIFDNAVKLTETGRWSYSNWIPGKRSPEGSPVREIHLTPGKLVLALANEQKKIWIYDGRTGVNRFIPVTNFYDVLMRVKKIRDPKIALNSGLLFENFGEFSDQDLGSAFLFYNKLWKKIELDYSGFINHSKTEKKKTFLNFFKRG